MLTNKKPLLKMMPIEQSLRQFGASKLAATARAVAAETDNQEIPRNLQH